MTQAHGDQPVEQARRELRELGCAASLQGIPGWLSAAWQRCLARGQNPQDSVAFNPVSSSLQNFVVEQSQPLIVAAGPLLDRLAANVDRLGFFVLLTNSDGIVIDTRGKIEQCNPHHALARVGVDLSEPAIGTSAISAALTELRPVWLHRGEHYFEATGIYSCAGAPIFNPQGACIGMLDLTGVHARDHRQLTQLVAQVANQIEVELLLQVKHQYWVELDWALLNDPTTRGSTPTLGTLIVGEDGEVLGACRGAHSAFGELLGAGQSAPVHLSDLIAQPLHQTLDQIRRFQPFRTSLWSGLEVIVRSLGESDQGRIPGPQPVRELEDQMIRRAVMEAKGNINLAAQRLGISRATIYRKLNNRRH